MRGHAWASRTVGAAVICLLSACASGAALTRAPASPIATVAATPAADTTAGQWLAALQSKDLDAMAALFTLDATWEDGATGESFTGGPQAERSGWSGVLPMVVAVKEARVLALGDGVAVVAYTLYGPTPAHSSAIDVPIVGVLRVKDAQITSEIIYYNPKLAYGS